MGAAVLQVVDQQDRIGRVEIGQHLHWVGLRPDNNLSLFEVREASEFSHAQDPPRHVC